MSGDSPNFLTLTGPVSPPFVPKPLGLPMVGHMHENAIGEDDNEKSDEGFEIPRHDKTERSASSMSALELSPPSSPSLASK